LFHVKPEIDGTAPSPPDVARRVFSGALPQAEAFCSLLAREATVRGLIGPREVPRLWERHLVNCALVAEVIPDGVTVADLGSGAGLPGLVLAIVRSDLKLTLVEPLLRRTTFLGEAVVELQLGDRVEVVRGRAEQLHGTRTFDVVTSRAVAPMERLARWSLPLVRAGGEVVAMKGASAADEVAEARSVLTKLGGELIGIDRLGAGRVDPPVTVVRVRKRTR
jgi:16S rRNA (guanine527-N7)-methyltransferase